MPDPNIMGSLADQSAYDPATGMPYPGNAPDYGDLSQRMTNFEQRLPGHIASGIRDWVGVPGQAYGTVPGGPPTPEEEANWGAGTAFGMLGASRLPGGAPAGAVGAGGARLVQPQPLMGAIGGPHPGGIQVYHSSPFDFTNFDLSKLRTGQGANAKGAGFYFAEHPEVSGRGGEYWNEFTRKLSDPEQGAAVYLQKNNFDRDAAIRDVQNQLDAREFYAANRLSGSKPYDPAQHAADLAYLNQLTSHLRGDAPVGARTYEVNIQAQPQQLLNLDKPLSEQPTIYNRIDPKVRNAIDDMLDERGVNVMSDVPEAYTGEDLYKALTHHDVQEVLPAELPESSWYTGHTTEDRHASAYLRSLDIPGMQFLDQASRNAQRALAASKNPQDLLAPKPTYNYVGVDPTKLNIYAKYALPGAIGAGGIMGGIAAQDQYQPQQ